MSQKMEFGWLGGDSPSEIQYRHKVSYDIFYAICQVLKKNFSRITDKHFQLWGLRKYSTPAGSYRLCVNDNEDYFVRVSSRWGSPDLERTLLQYLVDKGVSVNPLLIAGVQFVWEDVIYRVDVRPFVSGRHPTLSDVSLVASSLSLCHKALKGFTQTEEIIENQVIRAKQHTKICQDIEIALINSNFEIFDNKDFWAKDHQKWFVEMIGNYDPNFQNYPDSQCVHGQVHPGNVICSLNEEEAVFIDFETSVDVYAPPAWDLAYLFQRFCLANVSTEEDIVNQLEIVKVAYGMPFPSLAMMMRQNSWFSVVCAIDYKISKNIDVPLSEFQKFMKLEKQANNLMNLL